MGQARTLGGQAQKYSGRALKYRLGAFLVALLASITALGLIKGGLFTGRHEGDALQLLDIVSREVAGGRIHRDFETPIGLLATAPIALFAKLGLGFGHAFIAAQALVGVKLGISGWYVATSRLKGPLAWLFAGYVMVLALALVHGETASAVSISMYYNRWAWGLAYVALLPVLLDRLDGRHAPIADGLVIGFSLAAMALIKMTYFVSFAPVIFVLLLLRRAWRTIAVAILAGLAIGAVVTLLAGGFGFWLGYLHDLMTVTRSELRAAPGLPFGQMIVAPAYLGASLTLIGSIVLLRRGGQGLAGLGLLLLAPGFFYVQYQNWGNDPQWLVLLGIVMMALRPSGAGAGGGMNAVGATGLVALTFAAPSALNLAWSPLRNFNAPAADYVAMVPGSGRNEDLRTTRTRARKISVTEPIDGPGMPLEGRVMDSARDTPTKWRGETWPDCEITLGYSGWFDTLAHHVKESGLATGKAVFFADALQVPWLYGVGEPLRGAAPWYYGGLPGWDNADLLLVPRCALRTKVRRMVLEALDTRGAALAEIDRNAMYVLYARTGAGG